jgi:hypothetical protein
MFSPVSKQPAHLGSYQRRENQAEKSRYLEEEIDSINVKSLSTTNEGKPMIHQGSIMEPSLIGGLRRSTGVEI